MTSPQLPLGSYGVWMMRPHITPEIVRTIDELGFGALWVGGSPESELEEVTLALEASERLVVATGIVNIWRADAREVAESFHRIEAAHPGRFLLGIGSGHRENDAERHSPLQATTEYLDVLDAEGVPVDRRVISALGPKMLQLTAERSAGTHPYLTLPEHTRWTREVMGPEAIVAPEIMLIGETDAEKARAIGRGSLRRYLGMSNYTSTMQKWGFTADDIADGGSDALVDALTVWGSPAHLADAARAHLDAGASHVCVQILPAREDPTPTLTALAAEFGLRRA